MGKSPEYYVRKVIYTREEYQVIKANGNQKAYADPHDKHGAEFHTRRAAPEKMEVVEPMRLLTESEAGILGLPYEGERPPTAAPIR